MCLLTVTTKRRLEMHKQRIQQREITIVKCAHWGMEQKDTLKRTFSKFICNKCSFSNKTCFNWQLNNKILNVLLLLIWEWTKGTGLQVSPISLRNEIWHSASFFFVQARHDSSVSLIPKIYIWFPNDSVSGGVVDFDKIHSIKLWLSS